MRINPITGQPKSKAADFPKNNQMIITGGGFNPNRFYDKSQVDALLANFTPSSGGSGVSGYHIADEPDYGTTYVYVGLEHESNGSWYIYRRTLADNTRLYASGSSGYATAWTNRASQSYS